MTFDTMHILVHAARDVAAMDHGKSSDPFCTLKSNFNGQSFKTKIHKKTLAPVWNQEFLFYTTKAEGEILVKLWDHDRFSRNDFMGEILLKVADFADGNRHDEWIELTKEPLKKKKTNEPGAIHMTVWFTGPGWPPKSKSGKSSDKASASSDSGAAAPAAKSSPKTVEEAYEVGKVLGRGAFSVVKLGTSKTTGEKVAIKCISKAEIDAKELALLEREIDIMRKLKHPHIISLLDVIDTPQTLYLVLQMAEGGELFDAIVDRGNYTESDAAKIVKQMLEAIHYIHQQGIAHRDLKPENLLLANKKGEPERIMLADFGLSKDTAEAQLQTACGTPDYVAPEVLLGEPYEVNVDLWSIGVITYVLLCGFPPFWGETQKDLFDNILSATYDFPSPEWDDVSDEAKAFVKNLLVLDPKGRFDAEQALEDPWITQFTDSKKAPSRSMQRLESFSVTKLKDYNARYKKDHGLA